jgi:DNA/RNA-binding protein KIN17
MTKSNLLKGVSNRLKSKGLQKLRWYCQLCEKQCRDENGFKCHCLSESHIRRVHNFGTNQQSTVAEFSRAFELNFLKHLQCS